MTSYFDGLLETCQAHRDRLTNWLSEALGQTVTVSSVEADELPAGTSPQELQGAGLLLPLRGQATTAVMVIPAADFVGLAEPLSPSACAAQFAELARHLRGILLPGETAIGESAMRVADISAALTRSGIGAGTRRIALQLLSADRPAAVCSVLWPCPLPDRLSDTASQMQSADSMQDEQALPQARHAAAAGDEPSAARSKLLQRPRIHYRDIEDGLKQLPLYSRSLLRVRVPVSVTLAATKRSVRRVLELGPGAIIQFKKSCDETLTLEVGGRVIAEGEAVKVGDKFGLWITSMLLPKERFRKVSGQGELAPD